LRYLLEAPGVGPDLVVDLDMDRLLAMVAEEIEKVVRRPMSERKLPRLKASTIERKRRAGYSAPEQPMVATGALQRSIEVRRTPRGIEVTANWYAFIQSRPMFKAFAEQGLLDAAADRAVARWLETV